MTDAPTEHAGAADLMSLTADIVVAFLANNKLDPVAVPEVTGISVSRRSSRKGAHRCCPTKRSHGVGRAGAKSRKVRAGSGWVSLA